ncbi:MAG: peptide deformylase [Planctomycetota bacterium]
MELKIYPDDVLRRECEPLREVGPEERRRLKRMVDFMYECEGVGLAGPQVGWEARVVALDVEQDGEDPRIFLNPRLLESEGNEVDSEGCLSFPGIVAPVPRAERVKISAYTLEGDRIEREVEGLHARAWQHEVDHLNGVLLIDHLPTAELLKIRRSLKKLESRSNSAHAVRTGR